MKLVPRHIGFVMDGNRRFAKRLMLKPWKGHEWGADKLKKVLGWWLRYRLRRSRHDLAVAVGVFRS